MPEMFSFTLTRFINTTFSICYDSIDRIRNPCVFSATLIGLLRFNVEYEIKHKFLLLLINALSLSVKGNIEMSMESWFGMEF